MIKTGIFKFWVGVCFIAAIASGVYTFKTDVSIDETPFFWYIVAWFILGLVYFGVKSIVGMKKK